jgi:tetratricopeptide (TPR) repeat protein
MAASTRRPGRPRAADFTAPLTVPGGEVAGAEIVRELAPEVALTAWQALRSVLMWAAEEPGQRGDLFEPCAMADWERELLEGEWEPELRLPLAVLVAELGSPSQGTAEAVAHTCLCVADWALEHGAPATALAFAEAAALAWPQSARYAWAAGRLLRAHGRLREAERWLKRAARTGARAGDAESHALAVNSLGNLYYEQGDYARAGRSLQDGLRIARKHRLREREGEILHDLCVVSTWSGDLDAAERLAGEAFEIYRDGHPRLPALVYDRAVVWMKRGQFARALYVLRELPPFIDAPHERARAVATLARAAAACGDEALFDEAWAEASALLERSGWRRAAPDCVELGLGASSLQRWDQAEQALRRGRALALEAGEADVLFRAEAALEAVAGHRVAERERSPVDTLTAPATDGLAAGFLVSLRETTRHPTAAAA